MKIILALLFICTARSPLKTEESIAIPSSVKACGGFRVPPQFDVPIWHFKRLPREVSEGFIGLGHLVDILALLDGFAFVL